MSTTTITTAQADNGVNVEALLGAREQLSAVREAAQFTWRATSDWVDGTHARTTVDKFFGLGAEQSHTRPHTVDSDHPQIFASADNGMTPPELVLAGLAGCLTAGIATVATNRGIQLRSVRATVDADMDLAGILGIDAEVRNGFGGIRVRYEIDADAPREDIEAVVSQSQRRSAVFDIVTNPTAVVVELV